MTNEIKNRIDQIRNGEVPSGYKQTKFGVMCSEWSEDKLSDLYYMSSGNTPSRGESLNFQGDVPWLSSGELKPKFIDNTKEKITEEVAKKCNLKKYVQGTFVSAIYGLEADGVRSTCSLLAVPSTISQACMAFESKGEVSNLYLYYWYKFCGDIIGIRYAQGTKQQNLSTDIFGSLRMNHPHNYEQQKIAEILSTQDKLIVLKENLIREKENQNKYLIKKLVEGQIRRERFVDKWKLCSIAEFLSIRNEKQVPDDEYPLMAFVANYGVVSKGDRYDRSFLVKDNQKSYKVTKYHDFIYSSNNLDVGSIGLNKYGNAVISDVYEVFKVIGDSNPMIVSEIIKMPHNIHKMLSFRQGVIYGQYKIHAKNFLGIKIKVPSGKEQNAIAEILSTADREIELLEQDLAQEKLKKKALMQLLLTGIVRVNNG